MLWEVVLVSAVMGGCCVGLLAIGYNIGVRETERRWSDAVTRADDARANQT